MKGLAALLALAAGPAAAMPEVVTARYTCERAVTVPVTYVNAAEGSVAVLNVEDTQITLFQSVAASGARYEWPSGGSGYVWWSKGNSATLLWRNGADGTETPVYSDCKAE